MLIVASGGDVKTDICRQFTERGPIKAPPLSVNIRGGMAPLGTNLRGVGVHVFLRRGNPAIHAFSASAGNDCSKDGFNVVMK